MTAVFLCLSMSAASLMMIGEAPVSVKAHGGFAHAIDTVMPRVVKLYGLGAGQQKGYGSGILVSPDGKVLTVFSLLIDARRIRAVTADGTTYVAEVVHRDRNTQLALLQLVAADDATSSNSTFPYFDLSEAVDAIPGDWVVAAGNAFKVADGAEPVSIAHGIVSTITRLDARRRRTDFPYQGDVYIIDSVTSNPGSPGSAVVNLGGKFVGMIGRVVTSNRTFTHLNYALPRQVLTQFVDAAAAAADSDSPHEESMAPTAPNTKPIDLGIYLNRVGYQKILPFVERVALGSPAQKAGVRRDDLILSINGRNVSDSDSFQERVARLIPGDPIDLVIQRGKDIVSIRIETTSP